MRQKIYDLLSGVKKIEQISAEAAKASHNSANEVSGGLVASYSAAGDVEHSRNSANLSMQKYQSIKILVEELENALSEKVPETVSPVSFVALEYAGGKRKDVYLVDNPIYISGYNLISMESPIGRVIGELKVGDSFLYVMNDEGYAGKILEIG